MVATLTTTEQEPLVLHFGTVLRKLTEDEFYEFCRLNDEQPLELTSEGDLLIMSPTGGKTGIRNAKLSVRLGGWVEQDGTGQGFDSSTLFTLPNRAKRSPDFAWVRNDRWQALTEEEQEKFPPLCPDFVVELRSPTDSLKFLRRKMEEYIANGAQLGWLIDPFERKVYVYRPQGALEVLDEPQTVSGEPLLRGLALNLAEIWD
ncbi:MAG TPA: Uma2 family endonuclease [Pyrinomonadaceae bacterium]|jgi:Uma2 family endonuclease